MIDKAHSIGRLAAIESATLGLQETLWSEKMTKHFLLKVHLRGLYYHLLVTFNQDYSVNLIITRKAISYSFVSTMSLAAYTFYNNDLYITFRWIVSLSNFQKFYETYTVKTDLNFTITDCNIDCSETKLN